MPLKWVEPEVAVEYKGVKVYHVYRDNMWNDTLDYRFALDSLETDDLGKHYDVRELPEWDGKLSPKEVLKQAIENGTITQEEWKT